MKLNKNAPAQNLLDAQNILDAKTLKKLVDHASAMQDAAESDSALRHVPDPAYFKAKKRLRKVLERLSEEALKALCVAIFGYGECSVSAIIEHSALLERCIAIRDHSR